MARALPRKLSVLNKAFITTNMLRITLAGEQLDDFAIEQNGGYLKLHFARADSCDGDIEQQLLSEDPTQRPLLRTYTISQQRYHPNQIDIDFVIHNTGPASTWAANCSIGDTLYIAGPGKKKLVNSEADWFFLIGDMTALPALSVNIEHLPASAKGYAVIEILSENDKQTLITPENFHIHWVVKPSEEEQSTLAKTVKNLAVLAGEPAVWLACEFNTMRELRDYFLNDLAINKRDIYASSYWKQGVNEDEHKQIKAQDARGL